MSLRVLYEIQKKADKIECNKCGKCCVLPSGRDCKYLLRYKGADNKPLSTCRIYNKSGRIGTPIGEGQVCNNIMHVPMAYEGCPYNALKKEYGIVK